MRIGSSLVLIALGAILKFAVSASVSGISLATVGVVLMVVGIVGLVISMVMANTARRTDVVHHSACEDYAEPLPREDLRGAAYEWPVRVDRDLSHEQGMDMHVLGGLVTRQGRRFLASTSLVAVGLVLGAEAGQASSGNADNITFCHATHSVSNPYVVITTDPAGIIKAGHGDHAGPVFNPEGGRQQPPWGDVIPAFDYSKSGKTPAGHFAGLNLRAGQSLLDGSCQFPRSAGAAETVPPGQGTTPADPQKDDTKADTKTDGTTKDDTKTGDTPGVIAPPSAPNKDLLRLATPVASPVTTGSPLPELVLGRRSDLTWDSAASPILALTGFETIPLALSGVILLGFGAVLTAAGRRSIRQ